MRIGLRNLSLTSRRHLESLSASEALMRAGEYWNVSDWDGGASFPARSGGATATLVGAVSKVAAGATYTDDSSTSRTADVDLAKFDGGHFTIPSIPAIGVADPFTMWVVHRRRSGAPAGTHVLVGAKDGTPNNDAGVVINLLNSGNVGGVIGDGSASRTPSSASVDVEAITVTAFVANSRTALSALNHDGAAFTANAGSPAGIGDATPAVGLTVGRHPAGGSVYDGEILAFGFVAEVWDTADLAVIRNGFLSAGQLALDGLGSYWEGGDLADATASTASWTDRNASAVATLAGVDVAAGVLSGDGTGTKTVDMGAAPALGITDSFTVVFVATVDPASSDFERLWSTRDGTSTSDRGLAVLWRGDINNIQVRCGDGTNAAVAQHDSADRPTVSKNLVAARYDGANTLELVTYNPTDGIQVTSDSLAGFGDCTALTSTPVLFREGNGGSFSFTGSCEMVGQTAGLISDADLTTIGDALL